MALTGTMRGLTRPQAIHLMQDCAGHPVATCPDCREAFEFCELAGTDCPNCGRDLQTECEMHLDTCASYRPGASTDAEEGYRVSIGNSIAKSYY